MTAFDRIRDAYNAMDSQARLRWGYVIIAILAFAVALSAVHDRITLLEKKRIQRETDLVDMMGLKQRITEARSMSQRLANRLSATRPDDTPAKIVEETGIKGKSIRITPVKGEERGGFMEEAAEVKIEGLTANETVNLLHRLEKGTRPVVIKKAIMRTRFDDPARLDLTLTVALLRQAPVAP